MAFWDAQTVEKCQAAFDQHREAGLRGIQQIRAMLQAPGMPDLAARLRDYAAGNYAFLDVNLYTARRLIDELGRKADALKGGESVFTRLGAIRPDLIEAYCPELAPHVLASRDNAHVEQRMLLEPCANEALNYALPESFAGAIRRPQRAALRLYSTGNASLYVTPFQYQVLTRDGTATYDSGSPRALTWLAIGEVPRVQVDRPIVVVQDRFAFVNFSHFLFDGVTRILHYLELCGAQDRPLFVMGSIPGEYQALVLGALAERAGIAADSFYFPDRACLLESSARTHWFSDQFEVFGHPANMAHPRSISALGALSAAIRTEPGEIRRLYISRGDATRRRVLNEPALIAALEKRGFTAVQLAALPVAGQIAAFRGAEILVGPHGMGLTHIAMSERIGRMVELFPRWGGTAAYASIAQAGGIDYHVHGGPIEKHSPADFTVDVERVLDLIGPNDAPRLRPNWRKAANLIPGGREFQGFLVTPGGVDAALPESLDPPIWGIGARMHERSTHRHGAVGGWDGIAVIAGCTYTLSAWVLVPDEFDGARLGVWIVSGEAAVAGDADLSRRGTWQRIWATARIPPATPRTAVRLVLDGPAGCQVASAGWQLERGERASGFVATG